MRTGAARPRIFLTLFWVIFLPIGLMARTHPAAAPDAGYVSALAAANHFLQAWQTGDVEAGMVLLSGHAKETATADAVHEFFSNPANVAYEVPRGKRIKLDRYGFDVVLFTGGDSQKLSHRRFASLTVVNTGHNEWVIDKLP